MLENGNMLTTSISYGRFKYDGKIEFNGIEKNAVYGDAYVKSFLDAEKGKPKLQPGQCRIVKENLPSIINFDDFEFITRSTTKHCYYYWNLQHKEQIPAFEREYNNSYNRKYDGMRNALKLFNGNSNNN
jgi:hypothetical protein